MAIQPVYVIGGFFLLLFLLALIVGLLMGRRRGAVKLTAGKRPEGVRSITEPGESGEERLASWVSEEIEELVRKRFQSDPNLQGRKIDFGASPDGTLEIWIDDQRYTDLDSIPEEDIRVVIQEAVAAYNRGEA